MDRNCLLGNIELSSCSMMKTIAIILFLSLFNSLYSARLQYEREYQDYFASEIGGKTEVIAGDGTRCDILTDEFAIEVDFGDKWGEAIGQSLNYGFQFNRQPGIALILETQEDYRYFLRVNSIIEHYKLPIIVWAIKAYEGEGISQAKVTPSRQAPAARATPPSDSAISNSGGYWISSAGKTHTSTCRYYETGKGKRSGTGSGDNCKICGGAG